MISLLKNATLCSDCFLWGFVGVTFTLNSTIRCVFKSADLYFRSNLLFVFRKFRFNGMSISFASDSVGAFTLKYLSLFLWVAVIPGSTIDEPSPVDILYVFWVDLLSILPLFWDWKYFSKNELFCISAKLILQEAGTKIFSYSYLASEHECFGEDHW